MRKRPAGVPCGTTLELAIGLPARYLGRVSGALGQFKERTNDGEGQLRPSSCDRQGAHLPAASPRIFPVACCFMALLCYAARRL